MTDQDFSDYMEASALYDVVTCHQLADAQRQRPALSYAQARRIVYLRTSRQERT